MAPCSLMTPHMITLSKTFTTCSAMIYKKLAMTKTLATYTVLIWFLPSVYFLMGYSITYSSKTLVTYTALI